MTCSGAIIHRVGACTAQIPNRLVGGIGHINRREVAGAKQAGELLIRSLPLVSPLRGCLRQGVEVVGDRPRLADLPGAAPFGHGGGDRLTRSLRSSRPAGCLRQSSSGTCGSSMFFVDIEPDVEFSFCHMVCLTHAPRSPFGLSLRDSLSRFARLLVRVSLVESERVFAQHGVVLADRPSRVAREYERQTHHLFQGRACRAKAGPQP